MNMAEVKKIREGFARQINDKMKLLRSSGWVKGNRKQLKPTKKNIKKEIVESAEEEEEEEDVLGNVDELELVEAGQDADLAGFVDGGEPGGEAAMGESRPQGFCIIKGETFQIYPGLRNFFLTVQDIFAFEFL